MGFAGVRGNRSHQRIGTKGDNVGPVACFMQLRETRTNILSQPLSINCLTPSCVDSRYPSSDNLVDQPQQFSVREEQCSGLESHARRHHLVLMRFGGILAAVGLCDWMMLLGLTAIALPTATADCVRQVSAGRRESFLFESISPSSRSERTNTYQCLHSSGGSDHPLSLLPLSPSEGKFQISFRSRTQISIRRATIMLGLQPRSNACSSCAGEHSS